MCCVRLFVDVRACCVRFYAQFKSTRDLGVARRRTRALRAEPLCLIGLRGALALIWISTFWKSTCGWEDGSLGVWDLKNLGFSIFWRHLKAILIITTKY